MRKFVISLFALILCVFNCAYNFPEKLPAPFDFDIYTFEKVKFGQTSVNEFAYLAPNFPKPQVEGVYTIYKEDDLNNTYKSLRAGFKDNFLDWVELEFNVPQSMAKFKQNYGNPSSVNTGYSTKFNYQDYGFFNLVTDKKNVVVFGITLYGESDFNKDIVNVVNKLPDYKSFNFIKEFIPGKLSENDFMAQYPQFIPVGSSNEAVKKFSVPSKYLKHNTLYCAVDLIFTNGLLSFVNLKPRHFSIIDVKQIYGEAKETQSQAKKNISFREYPNFVITYDKDTNKVINIGIIGAN